MPKRIREAKQPASPGRDPKEELEDIQIRTSAARKRVKALLARFDESPPQNP